MLVVIEGADGCGKTSVAKLVAGKLGGRVMHFPNDQAYTGPLIRAYLRREWIVARIRRDNPQNVPYLGDAPVLENSNIAHADALAFQALQIANRMEVMEEIDAAVGSSTNHLVLSRYWQSAWVYGQLDGLSRAWLERVHSMMSQAFPWHNVLLDVDAKIAMSRRSARDGATLPERYEGQRNFTERVVELYRELWASQADWPTIDARGPLEDVVRRVLEQVAE